MTWFYLRYIVLSSFLIALSAQAQEICDNGVDDDGNGLVDLNDASTCACTAISEATDSLIPNPSFEVHDCWPSMFEQLACATGWYPGTAGTPDYMYFGDAWISWIPQPPASNGNGAMGGHMNRDESEYAGTCLLEPLTNGATYTFSMAICGRSRITQSAIAPVLPPADVTLWGYVDCPIWPAGPVASCPGDLGWTALGTIAYVPDTSWAEVSMTFTAPFAVQAIMIGAPCELPVEYAQEIYGNSPYVLYDRPEITTTGMNGSLTRTGGWCTDDLVLHASADTSAATFQWYLNGVALVGNTDSLLHLSDEGWDAGIYQVRISLGTLCITRVIDIGPDEPPVIHFTATPGTGCAPVVVTFNNTSTADTLSTVNWDFGDGSSSTTISPIHVYTTPGTYDVSLRVNGSNGCTADTTVLELIHVDSVPQAAFTFGPQPTDIFAAEQWFVSISSPDAVSWAWTFTSGDPTTDIIPDPIAHFPGNNAGSYPVQLVVTNSDGCADTAFAFVTINGYFSLYGPNAFTPNGDGINDEWRPIWRDLDPKSYRLSIFDRWGEEIWTSTDAYSGWDGSYKGSAAKIDVYEWKLEARDAVQRRPHQVFGHVTVVR